MPIYLFVPTEELPKEMKPRLIRAKTEAQASKHAVGGFYSAAVASPEQLIEMTLAKVVVENAEEIQR